VFCPDVPRRAPIGHEKPLILLQFLLQLSEGHIEKSKTGVPYRITDGKLYKDASPDARAFPAGRGDLRRTKATGVRSILGKEAATLLLGHASTDTTEIYLLDEVKETMKVAKQLDASQESEGVEAEEAKKPKKLKKRKKSRTPKKKG
jgi:hypothetical protein